MKKTTLFMVLYVAFLFLSPIIGLLFNSSEFLIRIASAATIAGYWFALADLNLYISEEWKRESRQARKECEQQQQYFLSVYQLSERLIPQIEKEIQLLNRLGWKNIDKKEFLLLQKQIVKSHKRGRQSLYDRNGKLRERNYAEETANYNNTWSLIFFGLGTITFFILMFFDKASAYFEGSLNLYSIMGCAVVMLNYIMSDTAESRIKKRKEKRKQSIDHYKEECKKASELIQAIELLEKSTAILENSSATLLEEKSNG